MNNKLLLTLISVALFSQSALAAKGGNKPPPILQPNHVVQADANGVMLGDAQTTVESRYANVYFEVEGELYHTAVLDSSFIFTEGSFLLYSGLGCTGDAYVYASDVEEYPDALHGLRDGIYYKHDGDTSQTIALASLYWTTYDNADCDDFEDGPELHDVYPASPFIDTNNYVKPYKLKLIPAQ